MAKAKINNIQGIMNKSVSQIICLRDRAGQRKSN